MTCNLNDLKKIINIKKTININANENFDYFRIASLKSVLDERNFNNILFFPITLSADDVQNGWVINELDLRNKIDDIISNNPKWNFVVEEWMLSLISNTEAKIIVVDNIMDCVDLLYNHIIENSKAKTIAITGSVGKTTAVGLIEHVLKTKYKVLRIYSKRITPLTLKSHIINRLTNDVDYIVLEMAIYHDFHVEYLSNILKPYISAIINIDNSHLGKKGLNSITDILINKSKIFKNSEYGFINGDDDYLKRISLHEQSLYCDGKELFDVKLKELLSFNPERILIYNESLIINASEVTPIVLTKLSIIQYLLAYKIGEKLDVKKDEIVKALNSYVPVENRIHKRNAFGKEIFFDGDISTIERLKQLSNNLYDEASLVIRKIGSAENDYDYTPLIETFSKYKKVYLFSDIIYLDELKDYKNVEIVDDHSFMNDISGKVFYHYSGYYRSFDKFDENNLLIHENEKYPIKHNK